MEDIQIKTNWIWSHLLDWFFMRKKSLEEVRQLEIRPHLCRLAALTAVGVHFWDHSHTFCCVSSALVRHPCCTHCSSCTAPAFTHGKNCQLGTTSNFPLLSFGSFRLTENDASADQTIVHTCSPLIIHGNLSLFWQWTIPPVIRVLLWPAVAPILTPHFIPLLPVWVAVPAELSGVGGPWNFRWCWVWSRGLNFLPPIAAPNHWQLSCFEFRQERYTLC